MTLAERAASAKAEETAGLLIELAKQVCPEWWVAPLHKAPYWVFSQLIYAEAYLDAAMMLAPQFDGGSHVDLFLRPGGTVARVYTDDDTDFKGLGKTPALAMIAARAQSKGL